MEITNFTDMIVTEKNGTSKALDLNAIDPCSYTSLLPPSGAMNRFASLLMLGPELPPIAYCSHPWYKLFATCAYPCRTLVHIKNESVNERIGRRR